MKKWLVPIIGIVLGAAVIVIGFCVQTTNIVPDTYSVGEYGMAFGADFYTEIYQVTKDVGGAVNSAQRGLCDAIEYVLDAIGWLIVAIGLVDIAYFLSKLLSVKREENVGFAPVEPTPAFVPEAFTPEAVTPEAEPVSEVPFADFCTTCGLSLVNGECPDGHMQ